MPAKKFLCNAPRPEEFDEKAQEMLASFCAPPAQRERLLQQTIDTLRSYHSEVLINKTGPGRKSNAEHAVAFYEYVLELNQQELNEDDDDSEEEEEEEEDESNSSQGSMDTQDFLNQHNDLCEVCDRGGDLLCCSTCNLVYHMTCVRPTLVELPPNDWACPHCIVGGVRGDKKQSKASKAAAAGVREMQELAQTFKTKNSSSSHNDSTLKQQAQAKDSDTSQENAQEDGGDVEDEEEQEEDEDSTGQQQAKSSSPENEKSPSSSSSSKNNNANSNKEIKKPAAVAKLDENLSSSLQAQVVGDSSTEPGGRSKRQRRQPRIYDPQDGPDSEWKSEFHSTKEGARKRKRKKTDHVDDSDEIIKVEYEDPPQEVEGSPKSSNKRSKGKGGKSKKPFCVFCKDDPKITICVFCACRVCFGKNNGTKLLICEQCDEEYHTFCLQPPLKQVPAKAWFCPNCSSSSSSKQRSSSTGKAKATRGPSKSAATTTPSKKKASPSPPKKKKTTSPAAQKAQAATVADPPVKRPRGRPPKNKQQVVVAPPPAQPVKKKRGRPPKNPQPEATAMVMVVQPPKKRGPGRPPKNPALHYGLQPAPPKRKRSRSPKTSTTTAETTAPVAAAPPIEVKHSRSGRTIKRNSFHDELEEGDQHLSIRATSSSEQEGTTAPARRKPTSGLAVSSVTPKAAAAASSSGTSPKMSQSLLPSSSSATTARPVPNSVVPATGTSATQKASTSNNSSSSGKITPRARAGRKPKSLAAAPVMTSMDTDDSDVLPPARPLPPPRPPAQSMSVKAALRDDDEEEDDEDEDIVMMDVGTDGATHPGTGRASSNKRKPAARECTQLIRRFGANVIPQESMDTLLDYCSRGKLENLLRMRQQLDEHAMFLEHQLASLEALVQEKGEVNVVVPAKQQQQSTLGVAPTTTSNS